MKVKYIGPHDGVEIDLPDGRFYEAERDKAIDVDDDVARGLLEQESNWEPADAAAKKVKAELAKDAEAPVEQPAEEASNDAAGEEE